MMKRFATAVAATFGILIADSASAQTLVDQMRELFLQSIVLSTTPGGGGIVRHTPVFDTIRACRGDVADR
jgi:hypothetical protein